MVGILRRMGLQSMITLAFKDLYDSDITEKRIEVPDFPYTQRFCLDGRDMRIALSPLEWDTARGDIAALLNKFSPEQIASGITRMTISDETGLLSTWYQVLIEPFYTQFGQGVEFSALKTHVKDN